jgi:monoamine oxidase
MCTRHNRPASEKTGAAAARKTAANRDSWTAGRTQRFYTTVRNRRTTPEVRVRESVDVVVVGAGVAGLACARALRRGGLGVVVLEARPRVGGRIRTLRLDGRGLAELGAQVVHGRDCATWDILRESGLAARPLPRSQELQLAVPGGRLSVADAGSSALAPWEIADRLRSAGVGDTPLADALSSLGLSVAAAAVAAEWMAQSCAGDAADVSAGGVAAGGVGAAAGDEWVLPDGYDRVPRWLAEGVDVRVGCPVRVLSWRRGGVDVTTPRGPLRARAAVVTVPPTVVAASLLTFRPSLPPAKAAAADQLRLGDALTVAVELDTPAPCSAHVLAADGRGGLWECGAGSALLLGVAKGRSADVLRRTVAVPGALDELLATLLPWYRDGSVARVHVADWGAEPWSLGGYSYPRAGHPGLAAAWGAPVDGTLFFAGEATCGPGGAGMVHGALDSGRRAAAQTITEVRP